MNSSRETSELLNWKKFFILMRWKTMEFLSKYHEIHKKIMQPYHIWTLCFEGAKVVERLYFNDIKKFLGVCNYSISAMWPDKTSPNYSPWIYEWIIGMFVCISWYLLRNFHYFPSHQYEEFLPIQEFTSFTGGTDSSKKNALDWLIKSHEIKNLSYYY